jgi:hypothetical protein
MHPALFLSNGISWKNMVKTKDAPVGETIPRKNDFAATCKSLSQSEFLSSYSHPYAKQRDHADGQYMCWYETWS